MIDDLWYKNCVVYSLDLETFLSAVRREMERIIGYWLELGVSGFRVDAVPFIIEHVSAGQEKHQRGFEYLTEFRQFLQ